MPASPARQALTAERRTQALKLKVAGHTFEHIAETLGYASRGAAYTDIIRALAQRKKDVDDALPQYIALELERLDTLEQEVWAVLNRPHQVVSQGRIVRDADGEPLADDGPILDAVDRLLKIQARRARLLGHDAPVKVQQEVTVIDGGVDAEIARLLAGMAAGGEAAPAGHPEVRGVEENSPT